VSTALVGIEEFREFLGIEGTQDDAVLVPILEGVETWFNKECGRARVPFAPAQVGRVEHVRGTGSHTVFLDYPIASVASVTLGFDAGSPVTTLYPLTPAVVVYSVGQAYLTRIDGGWFGGFSWPSYVHVTYDTAADLPLDAALAVMRVAAAVFRQRGSEDETTSTIGGQQVSLTRAAQDDPVWQLAVANHLRAPL
jgi:hypothetical protein